MTDWYLNFTAKNRRRNFLLPMVCGAIPIVGIGYSIIKDPRKELTGFNKSPIGLSITLIFILYLFGFFFYKYFFDNKIKLIIDKEGIWTPEYEKVKWQSVWYIYQKETRGKFAEQILIIKLNEDDRELKISTSYLDKTAEDIITAIKEYSKKFNIQFLDKEIV